MKKYNKLFFTLAMGAALVGGTTSCDDFEEINVNPSTSGVEVVQPYYALNNSIIGAQQDPHVAERIPVINWSGAARIAGERSTFLGTGRYSDSYNVDYWGYITGWIKNANLAITLATELEDKLTVQEDKDFNQNIKAFARIWRVVLISEFTDNFGPYPIEAFSGDVPEFNSVEQVYDFMLEELKAVNDIVLSDVPSDEEANGDPIYGFNPTKWAKFGNSLRLRLGMRLSQVAKEKAAAVFKEVDKNMLITSMDDIAKVKEYNQWNAWAGIYSRSWNIITMSSTMSNILVGLGGVAVADQRPDLAANVKPMNYMGLKFDQHYAQCTDNPTNNFWLDGIPENLDPRALRIYCLPNDTKANNFMNYGSADKDSKGKSYAIQRLLDENGKGIAYAPGDTLELNGSLTWNYYPAGSRGAWSKNFSKNSAVGSWYDTMLPVLCKTYGGNSEGERIWFGPWETHFLLAEAALYGWETGGVTAEKAYEQGIRTSFENFGVSQFVDAYLQSEDYNRIGVSVKFSHTAEPTSFEADYIDGYNKQPGKMSYKYPDASKALYKGGLNTQLAKIITQKYIAQTPYGTMEQWSDHRRLGLPFFDLPANDSPFTGTDMDKTWTPTTYQTGQVISVYPQRLRYPSTLQISDPMGYDKALELLGGENTTITPLWWAGHYNK